MRAPKLLVVDSNDGLARQVERAVAQVRPVPEVRFRSVAATTEEALGDLSSFDVLMAGPGLATRAGFELLGRFRSEHHSTSLLLVFDRRPRIDLRDIVRTGAVDVLYLPLEDEALTAAVAQALEVRARAEEELGVAPDLASPPGRVISVISATGGCGKTFFAVNLAYRLLSSGKRTCVVDLDLQFGELSAALRLRPEHTIADLLANGDADDDELAERVSEHLAFHETGLRVLAAPAEPEEADAVKPADLERVIRILRSQFDYVILDTSAALSENVLVAMEMADQAYAMGTLDLPSMRNLAILLRTLERLKVPNDRVKLVLNKVEPNVGVDVRQFLKHFPQGFSMIVPYSADVNRALNRGVPILAHLPRHEVSRTLVAGLSQSLVTVEDQQEEDETSGSTGLQGMLRRLRSA